MASSDFSSQFPPCNYHCSLGDHPPEAYLPSLTSEEKMEEPFGGKRKLLLRFQLKKNTTHGGALVPGVEVVKAEATQQQWSPPPQSTQLGIVPQIPRATTKANKNQKKRGFSFALSQEEIEADILAVSGMKSRRRPKKRSRDVKRDQLQHLFPGFGMKFD